MERNIVTDPLTVDEIKSILRLTENGTEEIISTKSKAYQELNVNIDSMPLKELYQLIIDNPQMLKRPIMVDEKGFRSALTRMKSAPSFRENSVRFRSMNCKDWLTRNCFDFLTS